MRENQYGVAEFVVCKVVRAVRGSRRHGHERSNLHRDHCVGLNGRSLFVEHPGPVGGCRSGHGVLISGVVGS